MFLLCVRCCSAFNYKHHCRSYRFLLNRFKLNFLLRLLFFKQASFIVFKLMFFVLVVNIRLDKSKYIVSVYSFYIMKTNRFLCILICCRLLVFNIVIQFVAFMLLQLFFVIVFETDLNFD